MSRIHSLQSKASLVGIGSVVAILLLFIINTVILAPGVFAVYFSPGVSTAHKLIDIETINQAITILNE